MAEFNWTPQRLQRLRSAVRSYNAAITRKEKELGEGNPLIDYLPKRVTVKEIKDQIYDVNSFRRIVGYKSDVKNGRSSVLTRVLKSVNPRALEFVEDDFGTITTDYENKEYKNNRNRIKRLANKAKKLLETELFDGDNVVNFDDMTPQEYGTTIDNTDIGIDEGGEIDTSVEDITPETKAKWVREDTKNKSNQVEISNEGEIYLKTWEDTTNMHEMLPGYNELINAFTWLRDNRPDILNKAFSGGYDELSIPWIIPSDTSNPYTNVPFETRHRRAVDKMVQIANMAGRR